MMSIRLRSLVGLSLGIVLAAASTTRAAEKTDVDPAQVSAEVLRVLNGLDESDAEACRETTARLAAIDADKRMGILLAYATVAGDSLRPFRREILDGVLDGMGMPALARLLREATSEDSTPLQRTIALRLVREREIPGSMKIVLDACANEDPERLVQPFVQGAIRESAAIVLQRSPGSADALIGRFPLFSSEVQDAFLDVFEKRVEGFHTYRMSRFLGTDARLNRSVLTRIVRMPIVQETPIVAEATAHVRWSLDGDDVVMRRMAAYAAARFHMTALIDRLLTLLEDPEPRVAAAARSALTRISGARLLGRKNLWTTWLAGEQTWKEERLASVLEAAGSYDESVAEPALEELARHRLHREAIVPTLARACLHSSARIRKAACETLGALGSPRSLDMLVQRVDDDDPTVAAVATAALRSITGLPAASDAQGWRDALAR